MPGNKCSNCSAYNFECKYEEAAKVRYSTTTPLSVYTLTRLDRNEGLRKGALVSSLVIVLSFPIPRMKICRKSRGTTGKDGGSTSTGPFFNTPSPHMLYSHRLAMSRRRLFPRAGSTT